MSSEIRKGLKFVVDDKPCVVTDFTDLGHGMVRIRVYNEASGAYTERDYRSRGLRTLDCEYIFPEGSEDFVFMDLQTGEQITVPGKLVDAPSTLHKGSRARVTMYNGAPTGFERT